MTFAIQLESNLASIYEAMAQEEKNETKKQNFTENMILSLKLKKNLERSRRENVTEITLEPIEGLSAEDYLFEIRKYKEEELEDIIAKLCKFYSEAGPKINVLETRRVLKRNLKEHEKKKNNSR